MTTMEKDLDLKDGTKIEKLSYDGVGEISDVRLETLSL